MNEKIELRIRELRELLRCETNSDIKEFLNDEIEFLEGLKGE